MEERKLNHLVMSWLIVERRRGYDLEDRKLYPLVMSDETYERRLLLRGKEIISSMFQTLSFTTDMSDFMLAISFFSSSFEAEM